MSYHVQTAGENVSLTFNSTAAAAAASPMTVLDANMNIRALQAYERIVIDTLEGNISVGSADVVNGLQAGVSNASTLIASFNTAVGLDFTAKEGFSLPVGQVPQILPVGTGSTALIKITGQARIMEGSTQGVRPNWRESANARGL